ncbi:hypothetical protein LCGC14_2843350, partial [marine sediment metagenome]
MSEACKRVGVFALIALAGWAQAAGAQDAGKEPIDALTLATEIQKYVLELPALEAKATPKQLARAVEAGKLFDKAHRRRDELEASIQTLLGHLGVRAGYFTGDARVLLAGAKLLWKHTDKAQPATGEASLLAWACILAGDPKPAIEALRHLAAKGSDPKVALWAKGLMPVVMRCHKPVRLSFKLLDGKEIRSAQLHGRVVVLDFWASYADPYKLVLPGIVQFYEQRRKDKLFVMVGLSWDNTPGAAKRGIRKFGQRWPQGRDKGLGKKLGLEGIPQMVVLSADGRIIFQGHPVAIDRIKWVVDFA